MQEAVRQTRSHLMNLFQKHGFNPRGDLGQNFLIDINIIEFIVREAELSKTDVVLEVGAGTGGMTTFMAIEAGHVVSVEYDSNMYGLANKQTEYLDNVSLLNCDALMNKNQIEPLVLKTVQQKVDELASGSANSEDATNSQFKLVANLPYNIATPIISNLVATNMPWERMVATIQLELAERMIARPGTAKYGALSVWLQSQCRAKIIRRMPPTVFWPRPQVDSAVIKILPDLSKRERIIDRDFFHDFVRRLFHHRRKYARSVICGMYRKQLKKSEVDQVLSEFSLAEGTRAEQMDVETLVSVSNKLSAAIGTV